MSPLEFEIEKASRETEYYKMYSAHIQAQIDVIKKQKEQLQKELISEIEPCARHNQDKLLEVVKETAKKMIDYADMIHKLSDKIENLTQI